MVSHPHPNIPPNKLRPLLAPNDNKQSEPHLQINDIDTPSFAVFKIDVVPTSNYVIEVHEDEGVY
jgi:hypothetical protein